MRLKMKIKIALISLASAIAATAQIQVIPDTTFPTVRSLLNSNFGYISNQLGLKQGLISGAPSVWPNIYYQTVKVNGSIQPQQPTINFVPGTNIAFSCTNNIGLSQSDCTISSTAGGNVTSIGIAVPGWLSVSGSPVTSAGTITISEASAQSPHQVIGTCGANTSFGPCALAISDLPAGLLQSGNNLSELSSASAARTNLGLTSTATASLVTTVGNPGSNLNVPTEAAVRAAVGAAGFVTSVGLAAPTWLTVSGSPVTASGTLTFAAASGQTSHQVIGTCGSATSFAPCSLVLADLPAITTANVSESGNLYFTNARAIAAFSATAPILLNSGVISCQTASGLQAGCLTSTDWSTFNSKQTAISGAPGTWPTTFAPPAPTPSTLGGLFSATAASHRWVTNIDNTGTQQLSQPSCADLSNSSASCSTDATNADNIASGTIGAARLPQFTGGDATTAGVGSTALSVIKVNGAAVPASAAALASNVSSQLVAAATTGSGSTVVLSTSPTITNLKATAIQDANGNPFFTSSATASAVDSVTVTNAATANPATVSVGSSGSDGNINLNLTSKGTGVIQLNGSPVVASATTDATNASNISSGTLPNARLSAVPNSALANSSTTLNGQTVALGATGNVNAGAAAHSVSINQGAGSAISGVAIGTAGRVLIDQGVGADPAFDAVSGDGALNGSGSLTVTKTNGVAFATSATTDATNATNITSGTLPNARLVSVPNTSLANSATTVNGQTCTLGSSCTVTLSAVNPQSATYQVLAADFSNYKTIVVSSGTFTITLVASGSQPPAGQYVTIINYGSGLVTIARSGQNINGGTSSLTLNAASATSPTSSYVISDGTNYFASMNSAASSRTTNLYYAPGAKTVNGVGASVFQCNTSCPTPTAITGGTDVTASLHFAGAGSVFDEFVIPTNYANQTITIEVMARSADNGAHSGTVTFTSSQIGANGDVSNPTLANSTAITFTPSGTASGLVIATGTFTPSWTAGNRAFWKAAVALGTLTSDLEIVSVRFYATF